MFTLSSLLDGWRRWRCNVAHCASEMPCLVHYNRKPADGLPRRRSPASSKLEIGLRSR